MTKTHKTVEGAVLQIRGSRLPESGSLRSVLVQCSSSSRIPLSHLLKETASIVVSTVDEAMFYALQGFGNILYPYPATVDKLEKLMAIRALGATVLVTVDSMYETRFDFRSPNVPVVRTWTFWSNSWRKGRSS